MNAAPATSVPNRVSEVWYLITKSSYAGYLYMLWGALTFLSDVQGIGALARLNLNIYDVIVNSVRNFILMFGINVERELVVYFGIVPFFLFSIFNLINRERPEFKIWEFYLSIVSGVFLIVCWLTNLFMPSDGYTIIDLSYYAMIISVPELILYVMSF